MRPHARAGCEEEGWRREGADMATVKQRTDRYVEDRKWLR